MSHIEFEDYRDLLTNSNISIQLVGADGTILWANALELETSGYSRDEYIGQNIIDFHADSSVI
jgi:PAS domain S-box-containing protein